jgi:ABC-2 type transport system permease protein
LSKLFHLVLNENMKIMYRPRFWLMIVILVASVFCVVVFISNGEQNADQKTGLWGFVTTCSVLLFMVQIFSVIIAGDIVASEFSWGTIKLLLIRPAN